MIKAVASDIDGTLILEGQKEISPAMFRIIRELKVRDVHFIVASGRQLDSQMELFSPLGNQISYISENGAICMHRGEKYVISQMEREFAMCIIDAVEKRTNCKLAISTPSTQYIKRGDEEFHKYMTGELRYHITVVDSFEEIQEPIVKIAFLDKVTLEESYEYFREMFGDKIKIANAGNRWIDFIPFDSNKGTALRFILRKLNLTSSEAVSFGDQQNDLEMLQTTKYSYAMAHSKEEIQKQALKITDSVEKTLCELFSIEL